MTVQERINMAKDLAEVRRTGKVNMFAIQHVKECLVELGCYSTAYYIQENKEDYISLLDLSGDF